MQLRSQRQHQAGAGPQPWRLGQLSGPHLEGALGRDDGCLGLVLGLDAGLARLVGLSVRLGIPHHLLDLVLAQAATALDPDALLPIGGLQAEQGPSATRGVCWRPTDEERGLGVLERMTGVLPFRQAQLVNTQQAVLHLGR